MGSCWTHVAYFSRPTSRTQRFLRNRTPCRRELHFRCRTSQIASTKGPTMGPTWNTFELFLHTFAIHFAHTTFLTKSAPNASESSTFEFQASQNRSHKGSHNESKMSHVWSHFAHFSRPTSRTQLFLRILRMRTPCKRELHFRCSGLSKSINFYTLLGIKTEAKQQTQQWSQNRPKMDLLGGCSELGLSVGRFFGGPLLCYNI